MFKLVIQIYFSTLILFSYSSVSPKHEPLTKPKIAIIGGGIGGTATAYFLHELFQDATIHLYEPDAIGGRLATTTMQDREYEIGGSFMHSENIYMQYFIKKFGLNKRKSCPASNSGLFDGQDYAYVKTPWNWFTLAKLIYRYGFDYVHLKIHNDIFRESFSLIHKNQNDGLSFDSVEDLIASMDALFPSYTKISMQNYLREARYSDLIQEEYIGAIIRNIYGSSQSVNAFVGSLSLSSTGLRLSAIDGGNKKVAEALLAHSKALRIKARVLSLSPHDENKFKVNSVYPDDQSLTKNEVYDAVAIAAPQAKDVSELNFVNFPKDFSTAVEYKKLFCTLVQGQLNHTTFKFSELGYKIHRILTNNPALKFNSIGIQSPVDNDPEVDCLDNATRVYKVFSQEPLSEEQVDLLFEKHTLVKSFEWSAYPSYESSQTLGNFTLVPGLFYNNALETVGSNMEMAAIAAKNVALLIFKHLGENLEKNQLKDEL